MTRVDFYILSTDDPSAALHYCCRLVEKAVNSRHRVVVIAADDAVVTELGEQLWGYRAEAFVPHGHDGRQLESVAILSAAEAESQYGDHDDVLINLGAEVPALFSRFQRVAELVFQQDELLQASRQRYAFYKHRGYPLFNHNIRV